MPARPIQIVLGLATLLQASAAWGFESASTVIETREQIERLPRNDIWWVRNGKDMAWNFKNLHRIFPSVNVYRDGPVSLLQRKLMPAIADHLVETKAGTMGFEQLLRSDASTLMGMVILHRGRIVFEIYPRMQPYEKPIYWSVTKVFVSALVAILEDRGLVDVSMPVSRYLPALEASAYGAITVRNLLDMASGLDCGDEYDDRSSCYYRYSVTIGDGHYTPDSPGDPYAFVASVKPSVHAEQGTTFSYSGVNTFVLAWLVEEIMEMPLQDALSQLVWTRMGAVADASILAPRFGVPITHGGLLANLRDVARFGLLHTPSWRLVSSEQILSDRYLDLISKGGNPALLRRARGRDLPDIRHNAYQWDVVFTNGDMYKGGWAGQGLLVNPARDVVAVYTGYFKDDKSSEVPVLPLLRQVLEAVFGDTAVRSDP